jgi:DNA-binding transcriptional ArsR family regulator
MSRKKNTSESSMPLPWPMPPMPSKFWLPPQRVPEKKNSKSWQSSKNARGISAAVQHLPPDDVVNRLVDLLQGLAHPQRLRVLVLLSHAEMCVGDIAEILNLSLSATSTMLKNLRQLGYVLHRQEGKQVYYRIASNVPSTVLAWLWVMPSPLALRSSSVPV